MMRITTLIAASLFATAPFGAEADTEAKVVASLTTQQGTVLVNQGEEFVTASDAQALKAGDALLYRDEPLVSIERGIGAEVLVFDLAP